MTHLPKTKMSMRNTKAGQLKILESVAVLIVFFFLVGIGINFYGKMQIQALEAAKDEFLRSDAIKISQKISHMPEIRCSIDNTDMGSCIDWYQAKAWEQLQTNCDASYDSGLCNARIGHYFVQIGMGEVVLRRLYSSDPGFISSDPANTITLYSYTPDAADADEGSTFTQIPIVIYDSVTRVSDLGLLEVRIYK